MAKILLDTPPPGYIPSEVAVLVYRFSRTSLISKAREGALREVRVRNVKLCGRRWVYYCEADLRRLWRARRENAHGGHQARFKRMPKWIACGKIYPVPEKSISKLSASEGLAHYARGRAKHRTT